MQNYFHHIASKLMMDHTFNIKPTLAANDSKTEKYKICEVEFYFCDHITVPSIIDDRVLHPDTYTQWHKSLMTNSKFIMNRDDRYAFTF